jgi:hypothetical protein
MDWKVFCVIFWCQACMYASSSFLAIFNLFRPCIYLFEKRHGTLPHRPHAFSKIILFAYNKILTVQYSCFFCPILFRLNSALIPGPVCKLHSLLQAPKSCT